MSEILKVGHDTPNIDFTYRVERRSEADGPGLLVDHLGGEVPVSAAEDDAAEVDPLPGRPHARRFELAADGGVDRLILRHALQLHLMRRPSSLLDCREPVIEPGDNPS